MRELGERNAGVRCFTISTRFAYAKSKALLSIWRCDGWWPRARRPISRSGAYGHILRFAGPGSYQAPSSSV